MKLSDKELVELHEILLAERHDPARLGAGYIDVLSSLLDKVSAEILRRMSTYKDSEQTSSIFKESI